MQLRAISCEGIPTYRTLVSIPDKAANGPHDRDYAEVKFTAEQLALEFDMSPEQAHAFLERYERWIGVEMIEAGHEVICAFAAAEGIARYQDFEDFED